VEGGRAGAAPCAQSVCRVEGGRAGAAPCAQREGREHQNI